MLIQFVERHPVAEGGGNGAALCSRDAMLALLDEGHRILLRTQLPWTPPGAWVDRYGDHLRSLPVAPARRRFPLKPSRAWPSAARHWVRVARERSRIERGLAAIARPDLTIVYSLGTHDLRGQLEPEGEAPAVVVVQESPRHFVRDDEARGSHVPSWQRTLGWAVGVISTYDGCIFASARCRDEWLDLVPALREKPTFAIPNTCDEAKARAYESRDRAGLRREVGWPEGRFVAACVASIQHRKGQDLLIDHLDELVRAVPDLLLVLVGSPVGGPWTEDLLRRIESSPHRDHVLVMPPRPHAMDVIRAADAFVLPTRAEAMPLALLEAMFLGTPIVASDVDGIPELIEDGRSGLLFGHDDPGGFVRGLAMLASSPGSRAEMAEQGRRRYRENFRTELLRRRYDEVVRSLVESHRPRRETAAEAPSHQSVGMA